MEQDEDVMLIGETGQVWGRPLQQLLWCMPQTLLLCSPQHKRAAYHAAVMELRPATHEIPVRRAPELQQDTQAQAHRESRILRKGQASTARRGFSSVVASAIRRYGRMARLRR